MEEKIYDLAVIGGGTGGYVAAIKAAQNGKSVCLIEEKFLGGTCLNEGCIPTKTLISNAEMVHKLKKAEEFGIHTGPISFEYRKMKQRKDSVVEKIRKSLTGLIQVNKITILEGRGEFLSPEEIKVKGKDNLIIRAKNSVIATGSKPLDIPAFPCNHKTIVSSTSILEIEELPKTLVIVGGGYIGCEFASLFAELGVKVIILEALSSIVSTQGQEISSALTKAFIKKGIDIRTNVFVTAIEEGLKVHVKDLEPVLCDMALISIGREICSKNIGLEKAGVKTDNKGAILVNESMETNVPGIYAVGDVTGKLLLAHVASHQGLIAASHFLGKKAQMHYNAVPAVIFTNPEIASVGMTVEMAEKAGFQVATGKFPFSVLGKSIASLETEGFSQIVSDKKTGQILGAHVVGHDAATLIAEMALAIENELTLECITDTVHAHPTLSEGWLEAALIAGGTPIHFPPKR